MRFFVLKPESSSKNAVALTDALMAKGSQTGDAPSCEACGKYIGMREWLPPFRVELETWGRSFGDLAFAGGRDLLASQRFVELWKAESLTGLRGFEPVEVVKVRKRRKLPGNLPQYYRVIGDYGGVTIDGKASGVEWENPLTCSVCGKGELLKRFKRIVVVPGSWTGKDVMMPTCVPCYFVTERFKVFCEVHEIKNAVIIPAEEYSRDYYPWENSTE